MSSYRTMFEFLKTNDLSNCDLFKALLSEYCALLDSANETYGDDPEMDAQLDYCVQAIARQFQRDFTAWTQSIDLDPDDIAYDDEYIAQIAPSSSLN